jgi:DNA-binding NarL/FixJ family response regulator
MKILVADDHPLYREAVRSQMERLFEGVVVREAAQIEEAVALANEAGTPFDLFLIDFTMPGMSLTALSDLAKTHPSVPIAVISGTAEPADVRAALQAGARGFIPKTATSGQLAHALKLLLAGGSSVPADVMLALVEREEEALDAHSGLVPAWFAALTVREVDVLKAVSRGLANKEIARELALAEVTVKLHLRSIFRKIGARSRAEAAVIATKAGIGSG